MGIKKINHYILGDTKHQPLEYRLFLSALLVGMFICTLAVITSIILVSSLTTIVVAFSSLILLSVVYYIVRAKRVYRPFIAPIIVLAFIAVSMVWVVDGGINGSNLMVGFVVLVLALIIVPDKHMIYVLLFFVVQTVVLFLIQLYRPDLITAFPSETARWIDGLVTTLYSSLFIFLIIRSLSRSYNAERKNAKDNELRFRALSENSQDYITRYDRQHRFTYVNPAGLKLHGIGKAQICGKTHRETGIFKEELCAKFEKIIESVFVTRAPQYEQYSLDRPNGKLYYDWRLFPELNSNNEVGSVLGVSRDITDLKRSEIELTQLNTDKDRFISILGHDLKSPLQTLLGLSELLEQNIGEYDKSEIAAMMKEINKSTRITYNLLEDILNWTKAQSGKIPYKPRKLLFADIFEELLEILGPNARAKNIEILLQADKQQTIMADGDMLLTIMRNLLSNAIKFTDTGGEILVKAEEVANGVSISVSDNGTGIAPEDLGKLFNLSEVFTTRGTADEKGTGLGLLLCREFVEKHGGTIGVESEKGKGSTFAFTLPPDPKPE